MIDSAEFDRAWAVLQAAMPELELPDSTRALYAHALSELPAGSLQAGVLLLVGDSDFDNRHLPTLAEMRETCLSTTAARPALPALTEDQLEFRRLYFEHYAKPRELGPGSAGHAELFQRVPSATREPLTAEAWEQRVERLRRQAAAISEPKGTQ